jgi:hypothetical protein
VFWWRGRAKGNTERRGAAAVLAGRRRSPPPAKPPAAGKKRVGRRRSVLLGCGVKQGEMKGLQCSRFSTQSAVIYTTEIGGLVLSPRSGDQWLRCTGGFAGWNQPKRGMALGRLASPAIGCWAASPCGYKKAGRGPNFECWSVSVHREQ